MSKGWYHQKNSRVPFVGCNKMKEMVVLAVYSHK